MENNKNIYNSLQLLKLELPKIFLSYSCTEQYPQELGEAYSSAVDAANLCNDSAAMVAKLRSSLISLCAALPNITAEYSSLAESFNGLVTSAVFFVEDRDPDDSSAMTCAAAAAASIEKALPYIEEEAVKSQAKQILPQLKISASKLSLDTFLSTVSLIVTIIFGLLALLPDSQLDRLINQNDTVIVQQSELIEAVNTLSDTVLLLEEELESRVEEIEALQEEVHTLRDAAENSDNSEITHATPVEKTQQQNTENQYPTYDL